MNGASMRIRLLPVLLCVAVPTRARALPADTSDPMAIMQAVDARPDGDKMVARMRMTITDGKGRKRERIMQNRALEVAGARKSLTLFESPPDVRNTGLLSVDWDASDKDDDQWLYLPSLHKSTRISSGDKSGAFMGSDFSYADMTALGIDQFTYKLLKPSITVGGEDCWLIEARPKTAKAKEETGYLKSHTWISKAKLMPIQVKAWIREGKRLKYIKFAQIKQVEGIWIPHRLSARTMRGKSVASTTVIEYLSLTLNEASVVEDDFTQRRLEKGL